MKPKVVILGNIGFIGSSLGKDLMDGGGIQVEGLNSSDLDLSVKESSEKLAKILNEETILFVFTRSRNAQNKVDAFTNNVERERLLTWTPIIKTVYSVDEWFALFKKVNYDGDYFWTFVRVLKLLKSSNKINV